MKIYLVYHEWAYEGIMEGEFPIMAFKFKHDAEIYKKKIDDRFPDRHEYGVLKEIELKS